MLNRLNIKEVKVEIGRLVRVLRKREKLSQQELADKLNISRITIQNIEAGKNFTIDTLLKILNEFDLLSEINQFFQDNTTNLDITNSLY